MNIPFRKPRVTQEQKNRIISDYLSKFTYKEIRERNHVSKDTIRRVLEKAREEEKK
jgi:DNA-directed RNA polymerase specialized sigma24 family protein